MLIDENPQTAETAGSEALQVATDVVFFRGAVERRQLWRLLEHSARIERRCGLSTAIFFATHALDLAGDPCFIRLQNLADAFVDFNAVTIEGNMTAGHHHAGPSRRKGMEYQRGRRDLAGILDLAAQVDDRLSTSAHDAIRARPQVAGDNDAAPRRNIADAR